MLANFGIETADGEAEDGVVGNDVVFGSGLEGADGDDGGSAGSDFAGNDGLQSENNARADDDGVNGGLRRGPVAAFAVDGDLQRVGVGGTRPRADGDFSRSLGITHVESDSRIGFGKAGEKSVFDHGGSAADGFFGGLADEDQRAVPSVLGMSHDGGSAIPGGHVEIVSARVHDEDFVAFGVFCLDFAGVGQAGFFFDGKGIEFGAEHDDGARAVLEDGDDTGAADVFGDFKAQRSEFGGKFCGGLRFLRGELGVLMDIDVDRVGIGVDGVYFLRMRRESGLGEDRIGK